MGRALPPLPPPPPPAKFAARHRRVRGAAGPEETRTHRLPGPEVPPLLFAVACPARPWRVLSLARTGAVWRGQSWLGAAGAQAGGFYSKGQKL